MDLNEAIDEAPPGAASHRRRHYDAAMSRSDPDVLHTKSMEDLDPIPIGCNSLCSLVAARRTPVNKE